MPGRELGACPAVLGTGGTSERAGLAGWGGIHPIAPAACSPAGTWRSGVRAAGWALDPMIRSNLVDSIMEWNV